MASGTFTLKQVSLLITFLNFSILVFVPSLTQTQAQATCQPSVEVVSIYGDDFKTPSSLPNYYIEVLRCVKCAKCGNANIPKDFPVPVTTSIIEIAVRPSTRKGYNVYSVFNHTSCGCGSETFRDKMTSVKEVYKPVLKNFNTRLSRNPVKVNKGKPQLRYKLVPNFGNDRYYAVEECIPSCPSTKKSKSEDIVVYYRNGDSKTITYQNDTKCDCSIAGSATRKDKVPDDTKNSAFALDSKKTFYISVLLTAVLVIVLLLDFTFCRQKKGFCYSLINCNSQLGQECPRCNSEEISGVTTMGSDRAEPGPQTPDGPSGGPRWSQAQAVEQKQPSAFRLGAVTNLGPGDPRAKVTPMEEVFV